MMYDDIDEEGGKGGIFAGILAVLIVLGIIFGGILGAYRLTRHYTKHIVKIEFTDGTVQKLPTHCSYVRGGNLEIEDDEVIRFFQPYDTWSFPIDKIKTWEREYEK